jgi:hypothetical protein
MTEGASNTTTTPPAETPSRVLTGQLPDITPAQLTGILGAVIAVAVSFGVNITKEQQEAILALAAAIAAILFGADAHVRSHRARAAAVKHAADVHADNVQLAIQQHVAATNAAVQAGQVPPPLVIPPAPNVTPR